MFDWLCNPIFEWFLWLFRRGALLLISGGRVQLGYLSSAKKCSFEGPNVINQRAILRELSLGAYSYIANDARISLARVGRFCSIGPGCRIGLGIHPSRGFISSHPAFYSTSKQAGVTFSKEDCFNEQLPVVVGNDVWIGAGVIISDGVTIGNGAIIAAGSVVVKDVGAYHVVGGVPAQLIRLRYPSERIEQLEQFAWWDQSRQWLEDNVELFRNEEAFFQMINNKIS